MRFAKNLQRNRLVVERWRQRERLCSPQRSAPGLLAIGNAAFDTLDPARHSTMVCNSAFVDFTVWFTQACAVVVIQLEAPPS